MSPTSFDFGTLPVPGSESPPQTFTVTNTGGASSGTLATTVGGSAPGNYPVSSDTCAGASLAPSSGCTLSVGDTVRVWIVDVDGTRLFIEAETSKFAGDDLEQEVQQIVESIRFE